jgi:hypothetical protein
MLGRYFVTGFSTRYGHWMSETFDAKSMESAKQKFVARYPSLKRIKAYTLR